jgi:hypothetical protein
MVGQREPSAGDSVRRSWIVGQIFHPSFTKMLDETGIHIELAPARSYDPSLPAFSYRPSKRDQILSDALRVGNDLVIAACFAIGGFAAERPAHVLLVR